MATWRVIMDAHSAEFAHTATTELLGSISVYLWQLPAYHRNLVSDRASSKEDQF